MDIDGYILVSGDPQIPDARHFYCPLAIAQHLEIAGGWTKLETAALEQMEFAVDAEMIGEHRSIAFDLEVNGVKYEFTLDFNPHLEAYVLGHNNPGWYFCCLN